MPSHFSTIGLPVDTPEAFLALARRAAQDAAEIAAPQGRYLRWRSASGAELWLPVNAENELRGAHPHFAGPSRIRVALTARVDRTERGSPDGAFYAWANPSDDTPESGDDPFVFDAPDFECHRDLQLPCVTEAQIAAFAHGDRSVRLGGGV